MEKYDYYKNVSEDVKQRLDFIKINSYSDIDEVINAVYDDFFNDDSITGNGSGSYTFSSWAAEENLCHNMDLLKEALDELGGDLNDYIDSAEACDVTIRCYVLGQVVRDVVTEFVEEHFPEFEF